MPLVLLCLTECKLNVSAGQQNMLIRCCTFFHWDELELHRLASSSGVRAHVKALFMYVIWVTG